jgi:L-ascorbate metabolism protein UlaG (beta-lactamase superfamily)
LQNPQDNSEARSLPHFRDGRFFNTGAPARGFKDVLRWMMNRHPGPWRDWIEQAPGERPPERVGRGEARITFVGHSTTLIQIDGINFVTDPIWSMRASPLSWMGPKRHRAPGIRFDDLPHIDAVLLSHNHYDHLDTRTLRKLSAKYQPAIFCPLKVGELLRKCGYTTVYEMDWWQTAEWNGAQIVCSPAQHFSARGIFDRDKTLWCGWLVESGDMGRGPIYFAGDTGYAAHFEELVKRYGRPRVALLPIGAYRPEWFMGRVHMSPQDALRAHQVLGAELSLAIHHGTFHLADDGETEAVDRLTELMLESGTTNFHVLREGAYEFLK